MCGICGVVNWDAFDPVDSALIWGMTATLTHRGPDDEGYFVRRQVGFGHRRLSIIDVAGGKQPIFNEDRSIALVFNGEIYNFGDLAPELQARGHRFRTRSDSETIVHAYEEYGDDCVEKLRGMFAFALWDDRRQRLLVARDRLGKKPLYYHDGRRGLAFASEIKALLEVPEVEPEVDTQALELYLALRYVPGPRTLFRGIQKLQPGHLLILDQNGIRIRKYWDIQFGKGEMSETAALEEFDYLLEESVRLRMISEVPVGVFLSGGLDSSTVLAMMRRHKAGPIPAYSVGYGESNTDEKDSNEIEHARQAALAQGAEHHRVALSSAQFRDIIPQLVWHLDEPIADPSCIPLYFLSQAARRQITVVLSGEGADEILAGYGMYRRMLALEAVYTRFSPLSAWLAPRLAPLAPGPLLAHYLRLAGLPLEARYRGVARGLEPGAQRRLFPGGTGTTQGELLDELFAPYFRDASHASPLDRMLYLDTKIWLPDDLLMKADKMTMASGLEQRVPFLDQKLVEFAFQLPAHLKLHQGRGKSLLRSVMTGIVPQAIIDRRKKGFPVPTRSWLGGPLAGFTRDTLLARDAACRTWFDPSEVENIVAENEKSGGSRHQDVWTLLVFEFWHRMFIETRRPRAQGAQLLQTQSQEG